MYSKTFTLGECKKRILKLLERYSSNGAENGIGEVLDIRNRVADCVNVHLNKLYYEFSNEKKKSEIFFCPYEKTFDYGSFEVTENSVFQRFFDGEKVAFYVCAQGAGQIIFYTPLETYRYAINTSGGESCVVRGFFDNGGKESCRFIVGAEPQLKIHSFVVYDGFYSDGCKELVCDSEKLAAFLPKDCAKVLGLIPKNKNFSENVNFEINESERTIAVPQKFAGDYIMEYIPYAPEVSENDDCAFCLSPIIFDALCYMCAADLCPASDGELFSKLTYKYREILANIYDRRKNYGLRNVFYGGKAKRANSLIKKGKRG